MKIIEHLPATDLVQPFLAMCFPDTYITVRISSHNIGGNAGEA